jgi:undecaprenyl diphosphate synthase
MTKAAFPPQHVAIIMDGNGRWAKKRNLPRIAGHKAGGDNIVPAAKFLMEQQIKYLTLFSFSTENWNRPAYEVKGLMNLLAERIDIETKRFNQLNIRLLHIGRKDRLPNILLDKIAAAEKLTRNNVALTLCLAFDYGSRDEIVQVVQKVISAEIEYARIDTSVIMQYLYTADIPDPDLIIRTGGEYRLSNFLLWQAAYSELYFTNVLWPDFKQEEMKEALLDYKQRKRRFGGIE